MGAALLALTLAGAALLPQERDPLWGELFNAWGAEFRELRALRAEPGRTAEADARHRELVARLAATAKELAVPLYHEAWTLSGDEERTPELAERLEWLALCASAARLAGNESAAARADQARAGMLAHAGRRDEARVVLEGALVLTRSEALRAYLVRDLAELHWQLGAHGRALELLDELSETAERVPEAAYLRGPIAELRSFIHIDLGLPDRAAEPILARLRAAEACTNLAGDAESRDELRAARVAHANWLLAVGDLEQVVEVVGGYLSEPGAAELGPERRAELELLVGTAEIGLAVEGEPAGSRASDGARHIEEALRLGLSAEREAFARAALAELHLTAGRPELAGAELARARERLEAWCGGDARLRGSAPGVELVTLEARLARARSAGPEELARARGRLSAALDEMLAAWSEAPVREGGVGWLLYPRRRAILGEHALLSIALEGAEAGARRALERLVEVETRGSLARRAGAGAPSLERIRRALLGDEHGILVYLPARGTSHVFALDREGLVHAPTAASHVIEADRRRYLAHLESSGDALAEPAQREWAIELERRLARRLAQHLFPPRIAERAARWRAVTIVGADALGTLPFEWLPLGDAPYLGAELALDLLPSLPLGVAWAERRVPAEPELDLVLLAGTIHSAEVRARWPELEPLALLPAEERGLSSPYPRGRSRCLRGGEATRAALAVLEPDSVAVLQLLVHGVLERERERPLALVLSADGDDPGLLRCADAENSPAPRLVVLTACRAGAGPARKGDPGAADMGGAWLAAGAEAVVLARGDLVWSEALRVSRVLHRRLAEGDSPAAALRVARAEAVDELGPAAPFLSASLGVVGLGQRPVFARASTGGRAAWIWAVCGALVAGTLLGARLRRR